MRKIPILDLQATGAPGATPSTPPSTSLAPSSTPTPNPHKLKAAASVRQLFAWCRMSDAGDAEAYLAGAVAILAEYPVAVMEGIADPVCGTKLLKDYPSLRQIREACELLYEPIDREEERRRSHESHLRTLPPPRRPRTPDEQAAVDRAVAEFRRMVGIPEAGLPAKGAQPAPVRFSVWSAERAERLMGDLALRKARNRESGQTTES